MGDIDREALRQHLLEEIERLRRAIGQYERSKEADWHAGDGPDLGRVAQEQTELRGVLENRRRLLAEAEAAYRRLEEGTYGICEACNQPIPSERLAIVPYTTLCVTCQSRRERNRR